jgi:hypothetical protein
MALGCVSFFHMVPSLLLWPFDNASRFSAAFFGVAKTFLSPGESRLVGSVLGVNRGIQREGLKIPAYSAPRLNLVIGQT